MTGVSVVRTTSIIRATFIAMMMEAFHTSETSVHFNVTTRHYILGDYMLHTRLRENLKSHMIKVVVVNESSYYVTYFLVKNNYIDYHLNRAIKFKKELVLCGNNFRHFLFTNMLSSLN
jgi:hypothetical protein